MTPEEWCTVFSVGLDSLRGLSGTPFSPRNPQNHQKVPKTGGNPLLGTFSGSSRGLGGSKAQKVRQSPPADDPLGKIDALFGPYCQLDPLKVGGEVPAKVPQGGTPYFEHFLAILGISR